MAGRIRLGRRGGRVVVIMATAAYVTGLAILSAPAGNSFGGSCNGRLSTVGHDASHEHGPMIIDGTSGDDVIIGSRGDDTIRGNGGHDLICGGAGADDISSGTLMVKGVDTDLGDNIFGEAGDDTIHGGVGDDVISGGRGNDNVDGGFGENGLYGDGGDDILDGSNSAPGTKLNGGSGHNLCYVNAGVEVSDCRF